jgi:hypothetical protein
MPLGTVLKRRALISADKAALIFEGQRMNLKAEDRCH